MYTRWLTLSVALVGCAAPPAGLPPRDPHPPGHADAGRPSTAPTAAAEAVEVRPAPACEDPVDGFARLDERGAALGLQTAAPALRDLASCPVMPGVVLAADLDGDHRDELVLNQVEAAPVLVRATGGALVEQVAEGLGPPDGRPLLSLAAADLDGDGATDLLGLGEGFVVWAANAGGLRFAPWAPIVWTEGWPRVCYTGIGLGDIDSDGDLDFGLPGLDTVEHAGQPMGSAETGWRGSVDALYLREDAGFVHDRDLPRGAGLGFSLVHHITDADNDGDMDLWAWGDRVVSDHPPAALWRNEGEGDDGRPQLTNVAPVVGAQSRASAMGLVVTDLNGDGVVDHCVSDVAPKLSCLLSSPSGYYEGALALGLHADPVEVAEEHHPEAPPEPPRRDSEGRPLLDLWSTWGLVMDDLDNDGHRDAATVAGPPPDQGSVYSSDVSGWQPDWIWQGGPEGFTDRVAETGFHSIAWGYGLVSADLFGDGHRELIVGRAEGLPEVWNNPCGDGAWVELRLVGPPGNLEGFGAQITLEAGGQTDLREVVGQTGTQQGSAAQHYGLGGAARVDRLRVRWPDGAVVELEDLPLRATLIVRHPDAAAAG
jgi:hypothetical protein